MTSAPQSQGRQHQKANPVSPFVSGFSALRELLDKTMKKLKPLVIFSDWPGLNNGPSSAHPNDFFVGSF